MKTMTSSLYNIYRPFFQWQQKFISWTLLRPIYLCNHALYHAIYMYVSMYVCMLYVCMYLCMYVYMYVCCMYVCRYVCISIPTRSTDLEWIGYMACFPVWFLFNGFRKEIVLVTICRTYGIFSTSGNIWYYLCGFAIKITNLFGKRQMNT